MGYLPAPHCTTIVGGRGPRGGCVVHPPSLAARYRILNHSSTSHSRAKVRRGRIPSAHDARTAICEFSGLRGHGVVVAPLLCGPSRVAGVNLDAVFWSCPRATAYALCTYGNGNHPPSGTNRTTSFHNNTSRELQAARLRYIRWPPPPLRERAAVDLAARSGINIAAASFLFRNTYYLSPFLRRFLWSTVFVVSFGYISRVN